MATKTASALEQITYDTLYERWEHGNWKSTELDFSEDREQWRNTFSEFERKAALWNYAMFFHGEDSVADNLSPYIDAAPLEEQKYFLTTQQVDEARHAVFFGRFMREVVERGDTIANSLTATKPELTWGFRKTFEHLDVVADRLRQDRSKPMLAAAITMYHIVVEATLAQPGQHFIDEYLHERDVLPGFREGMGNVARDEQRHIAFGVKILSDLVAEDPECKDAVAELIREVMPYAVAVFVPPNWDMNYVEVFGSSVEDVFAEGFQSFESKLRMAGLPLEEMPGSMPMPLDLEPRARAQRALTMMRAGLIGEKTGPPQRDPEVVAMLFDSIERSIDPNNPPPGGATIQWDFQDADPWFLRVDNGSSEVSQGRLESADLTLSCRFEDWVDIAARREDPRRALATRKLRPKGSLRTLWQTRKLFAR